MATPANIVLIGMPGAGKSSLGVVLAKRLGMSFVDLDITIQEEVGRTLQEIIDERGAEGFLELEEQVLSGVECKHTVMATGGSAVYSDAAMRHLAQNGLMVYLAVGFDEMVDRLGEIDERGVVFRGDGEPNLRALYDERAPLYEHYAQLTVDVTGKSIRESALELTERIRKSYPDLLERRRP